MALSEKNLVYHPDSGMRRTLWTEITLRRFICPSINKLLSVQLGKDREYADKNAINTEFDSLWALILYFVYTPWFYSTFIRTFYSQKAPKNLYYWPHRILLQHGESAGSTHSILTNPYAIYIHNFALEDLFKAIISYFVYIWFFPEHFILKRLLKIHVITLTQLC